MSLSEEIPDFECSICLRRFHDPIILNCGHTFDRLCIEQMLHANRSTGSRRGSRCPLCDSTFDPERPFTSIKSLTHVLRCEATFEWFLIDISSPKQRIHALTFLQHLFDKREIFETNRIAIQTGETRMIFNSNTNFEQGLQVRPVINLESTLREICTYLQDRDSLRKICILTDGLSKHANLIKVDANVIDQRSIIHIGDQNHNHTRELADKINFHFGYFHEKTLENYMLNIFSAIFKTIFLRL